MSWQSFLIAVFQYGILIYSIVLLLFYLFIAVFSIKEVTFYMRRSRFTDENELAISPIAPSVSIIAPAYNEAATIIENVRSLLSLHYENLELIIVNDGSKDNTLNELISAYRLVKTPLYINERVATKEVRGVYKSENPAFYKLIVVDKVNGGKADALNVGINISANSYIVCIDVDCILEQNALLKIIKPFLDTTDKPVICTGGVIRLANSCTIENGRILKVNLPDQLLPRLQTLEYIRAFLLGRMAWSRLNGLLIVSGAFGAFDKEIAIQAGGYNHDTVGEDMELVVRMRRYLEEQNKEYKVVYIPDPLCWTEGPADYKILGRQRSRWMRGLAETLFAHRQMFLNPNYRVLGMLSYPFWLFYEFLAPIIETTGILVFLLFCLLNMIQWVYFFQLLFFIVGFGCLYSCFAIIMEVVTYNQYKSKKDLIKLMLAVFIEPICFHPFIVYSSIKGLVALYQEKKGWGDMTRKGFSTKIKKDS